MTSKMNRNPELQCFSLMATATLMLLAMSGCSSMANSVGAESASWETVAGGGVA
jgi:hypothetical protein